MAKQKESIFKDKVREFLLTLPDTFFIKIQQLSLIGDPDFVLCVRGRFIALELKRSKAAVLRPLQKHKLLKVEKAGGISFVCYPENFLEVKAKIYSLIHESKGEDRYVS